MLPLIEDFEWHSRSGNNISMRWTNPIWLLDPRTPNFVEKTPVNYQPVKVVDYDVRFRKFSTIKTEGDFDQSERVKFHSKHLISSNTAAWSNLSQTSDKKSCIFSHSFFPNVSVEASVDLRSQFRERVAGSYAIRYLDAFTGWSKMSNVLYDNANGATIKHHEFDIRILGSGGFGPLPTTGLTVVEIRDAYTMESCSYSVNQKGISIGAPVSGTKPKDDSWVRFNTRPHIHLKDFANMGVNLLSQAAAIKDWGYGRMEMMIYDSERDASIKDRDALVAGPITLDGFIEGFELTGLSRTVGRLDPL